MWTDREATSIHSVTDTRAIESNQHLVVAPHISLSECVLNFVPHVGFGDHVHIVLFVLTFDRLSIEVAGIVDEPICSIVLRAHMAMNFLLLVGNYAAGVSLFIQPFPLLLVL